jgi:hypothetical protein
MSTWCEIVRYRANMKAVFSLTYDQNILPPGKQLDGVMRKQINPKNSLLRHSNFSRLNCPVSGGHSKKTRRSNSGISLLFVFVPPYYSIPDRLQETGKIHESGFSPVDLADLD